MKLLDRLRHVVAGVLLASSLPGQTAVNLQTQSKSVDFTAAPYTRPIKTGSALPSSCQQGDTFLNISAPAGSNLFTCIGSAWVEQAGSFAGETVQNNGTAVGSRAMQNYIAGAGILNTLSDTGTAIDIQQSIDTAVIQSRANEQAGGDLLCQSNSGAGVSMSCAMSPTLTAYSAGMVLWWQPDVTTSGAITLNIDTLGAVPVKEPDGMTNPQPGDILGAHLYPIWYDGSVFRLVLTSATGGGSQGGTGNSGSSQGSGDIYCASQSGSASTYTCATAVTLTQLPTGTVIWWNPDITPVGAVTLNVDTLGAKSVTEADGVTNPRAGDATAGETVPLWYDGNVFRLAIAASAGAQTFNLPPARSGPNWESWGPGSISPPLYCGGTGNLEEPCGVYFQATQVTYIMTQVHLPASFAGQFTFVFEYEPNIPGTYKVDLLGGCSNNGPYAGALTYTQIGTSTLNISGAGQATYSPSALPSGCGANSVLYLKLQRDTTVAGNSSGVINVFDAAVTVR